MTSTLPVLRVAAVGDSLTKGFLSWEEEHPYTRILEAEGIRVGNFGVNGAMTRDMVQQMERVVAHRSPRRTRQLTVPGSSSDEEVDTRTSPSGSAVPTGAKARRVPYTYVVLLGGTNDLGAGLLPETVLENLTQLASMASEAGVHPFLVTVPPLGQHLSNARNAALRTQVNDGLKQLARERGFGLIDLHAAVVTPSELYLRDDLTGDQLHLNAEGYDEMGILVFDTIAEHYERSHAAVHGDDAAAP